MALELNSKAQSVLDYFVREGKERGAQTTVYLGGRLVVDVFTGTANALTREPVTPETLFPVFSVTKGIAASVAHRLADRGILNYELPIAHFWPEFANQGKERITLAHALRHTAGLPRLPDGLTFGQMLDWHTVCDVLARNKPVAPPGMQFAYHAKTFGWLVGETARRADGRSFCDLVHEEIARPLRLDGSLHVGLRKGARTRIALVEEDGMEPHGQHGAHSPVSTVPMSHQMNDPAMWTACLPSSNGLMTAHAIAKHYAALLPGGLDGVELMPPQRLREATRWQTRMDAEGLPSTRGLGYDLIAFSPDGKSILRGFGHGGYGGSMGFAIPDLGLAFGYTRNRLNATATWSEFLTALWPGLSLPPAATNSTSR
jgi:CubicO group peptidase (beta-lactamase class C family)